MCIQLSKFIDNVRLSVFKRNARDLCTLNDFGNHFSAGDDLRGQ